LKTIGLFILIAIYLLIEDTAKMLKKRGEKLILGTSKERVRLLKNGIKGKTIEELYIRYNNFKIIQSPVLFDFVESSLSDRMDSPENPVIELKQVGQRTECDFHECAC